MTTQPDLPPGLATRADELLRRGIPNADRLASISADRFSAVFQFAAARLISEPVEGTR
jgi:hypothetical protein